MRMFLQMLNSLPKQMLSGNRNNKSETTEKGRSINFRFIFLQYRTFR